MASIKNLKKDINNVLGDLIEAVYIVEATHGTKDSEEGSKIIDKAIATFDALINKVHQKEVTDKRGHFKAIRVELAQKAEELAQEVNSLEA